MKRKGEGKKGNGRERGQTGRVGHPGKDGTKRGGRDAHLA